MHMPSKTFALAACLAFGLGGTALAQSTGAPAGREPATAPGGTTGAAGPRNEAEALRSGDAIPAAPGAGVSVPAPAVTGTAPAGSAAEPPMAPQARP